MIKRPDPLSLDLYIFISLARAKRVTKCVQTLGSVLIGSVGDWEASGQQIEITTNSVPSTSNTFQVEDVTASSSTDTIENLIVTTKRI